MRRLLAGLALLALAAPPASAAPTTASVSYRGGAATVVLRAPAAAAYTEYRVDGGAWKRYAAREVPLPFASWSHLGAGSFTSLPDGSVRTSGGLGMLWYDDRAFGDVALRVRWRDVGGGSNGGVIVRFPDPVAMTSPGAVPKRCQLGSGAASLALLRPEWAAVTCGHEIQVNDGDVDPQQTGSVYNFQSLAKPASRPAPRGTWNDYEVRMTGGGSWHVDVIRNGVRINSWTNSPGQAAHRDGDPPTDARQWATGYVGLQNHGGTDVVDYRDVTVRSLRPEAAAFTVRGAGRHTVSYRSVGWDGRAETARTLLIAL
jgi:hypothetical protein